MAKKKRPSFLRRKRMVVLSKRVDDALNERAQELELGLSPTIRKYVIEGLRRDKMLTGES